MVSTQQLCSLGGAHTQKSQQHAALAVCVTSTRTHTHVLLLKTTLVQGSLLLLNTRWRCTEATKLLQADDDIADDALLAMKSLDRSVIIIGH